MLGPNDVVGLAELLGCPVIVGCAVGTYEGDAVGIGDGFLVGGCEGRDDSDGAIDKVGESDGRIDSDGMPLGATVVVGNKVGWKVGIEEGTSLGNGDRVGATVGAVGNDVGGLDPGSNNVGVNVPLSPCPPAERASKRTNNGTIEMVVSDFENGRIIIILIEHVRGRFLRHDFASPSCCGIFVCCR